MATVHILGAGTPTPTPTRFGSSYVVDMDGQYLMVDCGPAATHKLVKAGAVADEHRPPVFHAPSFRP